MTAGYKQSLSKPFDPLLVFYKGTDRINHRATGHKHRKIRKVLGRSQKEMASQIGWTPQYLCGLEKGDIVWTENKSRKYLNAC